MDPVPRPEPLDRALRVGEDLALAPLRLLSNLANPIRDDIGRGVRRTFGVSEQPRPRAMDPDTAFVHPDSVVRLVHRDLGAMMIGGLGALMLQALHPLAMAGVADHSGYENDPIGRLRRTANFVGSTTFGTTAEARAAIKHVQAVHRRVRGVAPDGRTYSASDPELLTWVHAAEMDCFLEATQRFGARSLTRAECDAYYKETAPVAIELGAEWVPRSTDEMDAYFLHIRKDLYGGSQAMTARDFLVRGVARKPEDRAVYALIAAAGISLLPRWARAKLKIPRVTVVDAAVVTPAARLLCIGLRWAVPPRV
ncbi:MAG: oxygenase MpaB family protein [Acidimicrobiales bacterium]